MMLFWDPRLILRRLTAIVPLPKPGERGSGRTASGPSHGGPRCDCCPRRRAFVLIDPRRPGERVPCPSCGRPIGFVKPPDEDLPPLE